MIHTDRLYAKILNRPEWSRIERELVTNVTNTQCLCPPNCNLYVKKILNLDLLLSNHPIPKGCDGWGNYYNFTGHEQLRHCFYCGVKVGRRYCKGHRQLYLRDYDWPTARDYCQRRHRLNLGQTPHINLGQTPHIYFCADCGYEGHYYEFQVHHMRPMMGHARSWHWLNSQDNLTHLCFECHRRVHHSYNKLVRKWRENGVGDRSAIEQLQLF